MKDQLRFAFRSLRAAPLVTFAAVASLTLGIGATVGIFTLINTFSLRPLTVAEPDRLFTVSSGSAERRWWSYPTFAELQRQLPQFEMLAAWGPQQFNLIQGPDTAAVNGIYVSGDYFRMLGVAPLLGRPLMPADDGRGATSEGAVTVISHGFWQRQSAAPRM